MASSTQPAALFSAALKHHQAGQLAEAETLYRRVLERERRHADAMHYLGLLSVETGRLEEGLELLRRAAMLAPTAAHYHSNLAEALRRCGHPDEAVESARTAARLAPNSPEAHYNLGIALHDAAQDNEAAQSYLRAIQLRPNDEKAYNNLGVSLSKLGRFKEAIAAFERAAALAPRSSELFSSWSNTLLEAGRLADAREKAQRALELNPDNPAAQCNVARCISNWFDLDEAVQRFRRALELKPDYPLAHSNLLFVMLHHARFTDAQLLETHADWGRRYASPTRASKHHANDRNPDRRLRIGYVSPDFREHPVAYFIEPVLAHHDREQVEVFCYSNAPLVQHDTVTARIKSYGHQWRDVAALSDAKLARQIQEVDRIDVLVDLSGHTAEHRLSMFGLKPAPVQATYLGYQGTSGVSAIDYRLTDSVVDPPGATDAFHTERLERLEDIFACYRPPAGAPDVAPAPPSTARGANGTISFGAYTKVEKMSAPTLDLWAAVLKRVENARLIVFTSAFDEPTIAGRFRELMATRGIDTARLETVGRQPMAQYLESHARVDIVLDTIPFNGHTTSCHALWMGVPIVTRVGTRYASRMGLALLKALNLEDLAAHTDEDYVRIAAELAGDPRRLTGLRKGMRQRMRESVICDEPRFARRIEDVYRRMWKRWCTSPAAQASPG